MKTLITTILIASTPLSSISNVVNPFEPINEGVIRDMLTSKHVASTFKFANKAEIVTFTKKYAKLLNLDPKMVLGILKQESQFCKYKLNTKSRDYGCMQVNAYTAKAYNFNLQSIKANEAYSILAGLIILKDLRKHKIKTLKHKWPCAYNIGNKYLPKTCDVYLAKIAYQ